MHVGTVGQLQKFLKGLKSSLKGFLGQGHLQNKNLGA